MTFTHLDADQRPAMVDVSGKVETPQGLLEDTIPEDQSLVLNTARGLVVVTGCERNTPVAGLNRSSPPSDGGPARRPSIGVPAGMVKAPTETAAGTIRPVGTCVKVAVPE